MKLATLFLIAVLGLRILGDHSTNDHYTGDYLSDVAGLTAAKNYSKFGFKETFGLPALYYDENATRPSGFYLHYPPLPYILHSLPTVIFGVEEVGTRVFVVLLSVLSLYFAYLSFSLLGRFLGLKFESRIFALLMSFLFFSPTFLCFADTINSQPTLLLLFWIGLYWTLRFLNQPTPIWPAFVILFIQVWVSFDWIVPCFFIFAYCFWTDKKVKSTKIFRILALGIIGVLLPVILRVGLNGWFLGGVDLAIQDFLNIAQVRGSVMGRPDSAQYSFLKHISKMLLSLFWFVGLPALLLIITGCNDVFQRFKTRKRLAGLMLGWLLGGFSWQVFMSQHGMVHAFTYLHFSVVLLVFASLSFWGLAASGKKHIAYALLALQLVFVGSVIDSEVLRPFHRQRVLSWISAMCAEDRETLKVASVNKIGGLAAYSKNLAETMAVSADCGSESTRALSRLTKYLYFFRSSY